MTIKELIELVNPLDVSRTKPEGEIGPLVQNSRQVTDGAVFIAIRGTEVDGHLFLEDAIHRGAKVLICEESFYTDAPGVCVIEVENTRSLIGPLSQQFEGNPAKELTVIGITGTNGKTTTATLVYQILTAVGRKASLLGTVSKVINDEVLESKLTTSDPIELAADMRAMVDAGSEYLVMEVSSHALHQQRVGGIDFSVAAFTNLSHDHLDYHETLEEYANAKKLLFDGLSESTTAVVNTDDAFGRHMLCDTKAKAMPFGFNNSNASIISSSQNGLVISINGTEIRTPLIGTFNAYNVAQAFLIASALGIAEKDITSALNSSIGAAGRMESIDVDFDAPKVIVDYAHTPDALENVLKTLKELKNQNQQLYVVFGAGGDRDTTKRPEMAEVCERIADEIIVTSDNPRRENPDLIIADILQGFTKTDNVSSITLREEAINTAIKRASNNDIVLIAGKGHEDYQEIDGIRHPFDDCVIARKALHLKNEGGF